MSLTIYNLSKVDNVYIGKDTVFTFAGAPEFEIYNVKITSEDKTTKHLVKPRHCMPQRNICSPANVPGPCKVHLQDKEISTDIHQRFEEMCEEYGQTFSKHNEDIGRTKLVKMDVDTGDSPPVSSSPYTLPLKHYEWIQKRN